MYLRKKGTIYLSVCKAHRVYQHRRLIRASIQHHFPTTSNRTEATSTTKRRRQNKKLKAQPGSQASINSVAFTDDIVRLRGRLRANDYVHFQVASQVRHVDDAVDHLLDGGHAGELRRRLLDLVDDGGQALGQRVRQLQHFGADLGAGDVAVDGVADVHQAVGAQNHKLAVRQEDLGRLIVLDGIEEGVDGVRQIQRVGGALSSVKIQDLRKNHETINNARVMYFFLIITYSYLEQRLIVPINP